jgi:DNA-binding NtrC family response regulator
MSITVAPRIHKPGSICDPRVAYLIVLRPAEEDQQQGSAAPTIFSGMVARSAAMLKIFQLIERLSESDATVLITGESGTGKELVARAIHAHSERSNNPFLPVNCGALPGELLESELFGHVKGAFTGAVRDRAGRFEVAQGGTILLDEVAEMAVPLQVKLLRVLQEKTFERVGESMPRRTDARVLAATNRDLQRAVLDGDFRDDLYYRLRVVPIEIPPLRDRREDIEPLTHHLLSRVNARHDRAVRLGPEAMRAMLRYDWPGNVRELENSLEYAVAVSQGQTIHPNDLPVEVAGSGVDRPVLETAASAELPPQPDQEARSAGVATPPAPPAQVASELDRIQSALNAHQWRRSEAADALGISRTTLWRKMREHGLIE